MVPVWDGTLDNDHDHDHDHDHERMNPANRRRNRRDCCTNWK